MNCGIVGFGIWNTAQGIRNPTNRSLRNPESSKRGIQNLRVRSFGMIQIRIIDPRSFGSWYVDQMNR